MRGSLTVVLIGLSLLVSAQTSLTFDSLDGTFRVHYPNILLNCMAKQATPSDSCMSQGSLCSGPGSDGTPKACFAYPRERLRDKPMFVAGAFFVSEIESAKTEKQCLKPSSNWLLISSKGIITINDVPFASFEIGDNWAGGGQDGPVYRNFHNRKCYELGIQIVTSRAAYDPESHTNLTERDLASVNDRLKEALGSFVFLR